MLFDLRPNIWSSPSVLVLGVLILLWVGVSAYVLVTRALFDFRHLAFHGARRVVEFWLVRAGSDEERSAILRRLPRRTLAGIASDARVDPEVARLAAGILLERRWERLARHAVQHRTEADKWRRIATLKIFDAAGWRIADALLAQALDEDDPDVRGAAVAILGGRTDMRATRMLVDALVTGSFSRSRIATHLDGRDIASTLLPLLDHRDADVRYWGVTLLSGDVGDPAVEISVAALAGDRSAEVRAAVAKAFRLAPTPAARAIALCLLDDPEWFVRAQAARNLIGSRDPGTAAILVPLLRDRHWWVRTAVKETLASFEGDSLDALVPMLADRDEFARNGAAEVLASTGTIARWAHEAADEPDDAPLSLLITRALGAGGPPVQRAAAASTSDRARKKIERLIDRASAAA